jgi:hypothetical protein
MNASPQQSKFFEEQRDICRIITQVAKELDVLDAPSIAIWNEGNLALPEDTAICKVELGSYRNRGTFSYPEPTCRTKLLAPV